MIRCLVAGLGHLGGSFLLIQMAKKNLPNIPIYIGDWERDCNVLSLEAEAAWMRIVFKLWTNGKQNTSKMPAKSLQNLWRCGPDKVNEILDELKYNDICEIHINGAFVEFTCRRFVRENEISEIRREAAKGKREAAKFKQKQSKNEAKQVQNADIDYENIDKGGAGEKDFSINVGHMNQIINNQQNHTQWIETTYMAYKLEKKRLGLVMKKFNENLVHTNKVHESVEEYKIHLLNWMAIVDGKGKLDEFKK